MFRALASGLASIAEGMASIFNFSQPPRPSFTSYPSFTSKTLHRTLTTTVNGKETVKNYEDMTPEEQRAFDKSFEDMDAQFGKMDEEFKKAFDHPFFRGHSV